ncbi:PREDICTED: anoctamin-8 isoform X3 [Dinoponera quadriceps]|uniref:Anoctamin n=1 Tax=Dinoponera quadriceps TaxID=609295 RepID=A0A6P3Y908_DINQU|nr:PREDICTED: anoctamin-8 isoform X3 [Dinoponera quadriceps]
MPGGEGSSINLLDRHHHRTSAAASTATGSAAAAAATAADECANDDDVGTTAAASTTGATLGSGGNAMTSALAGDGLRRRKVIHAAKETLDKASRLLRRKIPCTGHLMTPRRLWIQKVPTQECDVVMMFPSGASDETLMWLLGRLRAGTPGLTVHVRHHTSSDSYGFYITAPFSVLLKAAEEVHLPKALRQEFGGGLKEFVGSEANCFEGSDDEIRFFTTQERQSLVMHLLHTLRAGPHDLQSLPGFKLVEGQAIIPKCISSGIISQVFPLHELPALEKLQRTWVRAFLSPQPLDDICKYFGVKITMYFAWLGHYTTALIVPAAVGVIYWVGIIGRNQAVEDVAYVLFSVFNVIWATVYLETWKRRGAELAYRWGTLDQRDDLLVEPRPLFTGTLEISPVTGRLEPTYPRWRRNMFRYFVSVPIIAICLLFVFIVMILSFQIQDWWDAHLESGGYGFWLSYVPKVLLAVVIALMDEAYFKVAVWLNDLENYRLDTEYENHLIYKVALFQFVNSFLSLFYIAFYLQDQERLKEQLAALLIARQVIGNLKESAVPYLIEQLRLARLSFELFGALSPSEARPAPGQEGEEVPRDKDKEEEKDERSTDSGKSKQRNVSQAELESSLYRVGHPTNSLLSDVAFKYDGAFSEHLEMLSQLGYVCLFSSAFPLAAMAALLGNLLELRGDAFKLCFVLQRPFGRRVSNIGTWQNAMETMGLVAILVNCALIGLSGQVQRMFPEMSATQTILLIVALEHIMFAIRFVIICAIPDIPHWVATEMAKVEFLRREAVRRLSSTPSPEQQPATVIADGENEEQHLLTDRTGYATTSQAEPATLASTTHTPSGPTTPSAASVPRIAETPPTAESPGGSGGSSSETSSPFLPEGNSNTTRDIRNSPRCSIPGGERVGRRSREWLSNEPEASGGTDQYSHHLTIGPHGGVDWVRRLGLEPGGRKSSDSEISGATNMSGREEELTLHRSTDCIVSKELASSSDSDLLRSAPPWSVAHRSQKFRFSPEKEREREKAEKQQQQYRDHHRDHHHHQRETHDYRERQSYLAEKEREKEREREREREKEREKEKDSSGLSDSSKTISSQEEDKPTKEEREAKKTRVKQSLMKRARSVAIFSLKLKERRAREAELKAKEAEREARWQQPQSCVGGELSCIPIEKLISVDDIAAMESMRRLNH